MKKFFTLKVLILLPFLLYIGSLEAQVKIGADSAPNAFSVLELVAQYETGVYGGLRLPQMTTAERDGLGVKLLPSSDVSARGLLIYNLDNDCIEYWNSKKWVSLCTGQASITLDCGGDDASDPFAADGTDELTCTPHDEP